VSPVDETGDLRENITAMDYTIHRFVESEEVETHLDDCLREILEEGTVLVVLSRDGRPVAEMRQIPDPQDELRDRLRVLSPAGLRRSELRSRTAPLSLFIPVTNLGRPVSDAIIEDREDRF
jgi:hypothetical protein